MFTMYCGIPGSGKTHQRTQELQRYLENGYEKVDIQKLLDAENPVIPPKAICVICPDDIRQELLGDASDQSRGNLIFKVVDERIRFALEHKIDVLYDATNTHEKTRRKYADMAKDTRRKLVVCAPGIIESKAGNVERTQQGGRFVPVDVINKMDRYFDEPTKLEGWDEIEWHGSRRITREELERTIEHLAEKDNQDDWDIVYRAIPPAKRMEGYSQDTPYHSLDLRKHTWSVLHTAKVLLDKIPDISEKDKKLVLMAALLHDIGKPDVRTDGFSEHFDKIVAHYYGHAKASAQVMKPLLQDLGYSQAETDKLMFYVKEHDHYSQFVKEDGNIDIPAMMRAVGKQSEAVGFKELMCLSILSIADRSAHTPMVVDKNGLIKTNVYEDMKQIQKIAMAAKALSSIDPKLIAARPGKNLSGYSAVFYPPDVIRTLQAHEAEPLMRDVDLRHTTLQFSAKEALETIPQEMLGKAIPVEVIGYGCDGKNSGFLVCIPESLHAQSGIAHITMSLGEKGKAVDTAHLEFKPIEPFMIAGQIGYKYNSCERVIWNNEEKALHEELTAGTWMPGKQAQEKIERELSAGITQIESELSGDKDTPIIPYMTR